MKQSSILSSVPKGLKSDCYFVVNNEENVKKNGNKVNCEYHDDCGAWSSNDTRMVDMAYVHTNSSLHHERKKEGKYCVKKKISNKDIWKPLEPQPNESDIVVLHKYCATLKRSSEFAKRVSWYKKLHAGSEEKLSVAVIEYIG